MIDSQTTTTESQLAAALAARGRIVAPADIANWRKNGLLPPLASHGLGPGKGKVHCWHDKDILARAITIFDAIKKHGRTEQAVLMLFFSGYSVPLAKFRRAWAARLKQRKPRAIESPAPESKATDATTLLLQPILAMGAAFRPDENSAFVIRAVEHGMARLGYGGRSDAGQLCRIMAVTAMALDASDLVQKADAGEMQQAQQHLATALTFLDGGTARRSQLTEAIGPALFAFILALLRSGQHAALESIRARIEDVSRPAVPARPAHIFQSPAADIRAAG